MDEVLRDDTVSSHLVLKHGGHTHSAGVEVYDRGESMVDTDDSALTWRRVVGCLIDKNGQDAYTRKGEWAHRGQDKAG